MASLIGSRPVSQQHPIPTVWMIVLGRAKTNSSSTRGPNKLADLKLQGHARRFRPPPPFLVSGGEMERKCEADRRWRGRKTTRNRVSNREICPLFLFLFNAYSRVFVVNCWCQRRSRSAPSRNYLSVKVWLPHRSRLSFPPHTSFSAIQAL